MARNVGSIEVSVEADTGKLKAQLVKDGRAAGSAAKSAIEHELRNVEAELSLNSTKARAELRQLRQAIDRIDGEIEIGLDEGAARARLAELDRDIEDLQANIEVALSPGAVAAAKEKIANLEEAIGLLEVLISPQMSETARTSVEQNLRILTEQKRVAEIGLEADPTKLEAQLTALVEERRDLEFTLEFAPQARAILQSQLRRIESEDRTIQFRAELEAKQTLAQLKAIEDTKVQIGLALETGGATTEYKEWQLRLETDEAVARVTGNFDEFNLSLRELKAKMALEKFDLPVDADTLKALATLDAFQASVEANDLKVPVDADLKKIREALTVFREFQEHNDIEIPIGFDVDSLDKMLASAEAKATASGGKAGQGFGDGFGKFFPGAIKQWAPLVGVALGPAVQAIEGLAGGAVQVVSSAFSALGGAAGAAAPLVAGLGATMGAVVIGSLGMGKAIKASSEAFTEMEETGTVSEATLKKVDKAMRQLTPAAAGVVQEIAAMLPMFRQIQSVVAAHLFEGLASEMRALSQETIPDIGTSLAMAADSANRFAKEVMSAIRGIDFSGTFAQVQPAIDSLGRAIANVVRAIEPFLKAAAPAARELARWIEDASASFLSMVKAGAGSGAITRFLLEGVQSLKEWARLVGATADALFTLFQAGKSGGDGMIASLTTIVQKWDAWMESTAGQTALQDFFATSRQLLSDLVPLIKGVADGIGSIVSPAAGASFRQLTEGLGDIARVAGELINVFNQMNITGTIVAALGQFADAIERIMPSLSKLASAIGESLGAALQIAGPAIEGIATAIGFLADILTPLAPAIVGISIAFGAWKVIKGIVDSVTSAVSGLNPWVLGIGAALGIAMYAIQAFGAEEAEVSARASEVADALETQVNALLETATQATAAELGVQALAKALSSAGTDGEKLTSSLGTLGKTADDSLDVLQSFGKEGANTTAALTELAKSAGLTGAGVADLVSKVASAEDPFFGVSEANTQLAAKLGISTDELARVGHAMEEVQDQAQKTDIQQMTREFLATSAASTDLNAKLLAQAEAMTGVSRNADDVSGLYQTYTTLLAENAAQANASKESTDALAGGLEKLPPTLQQIAEATGMSTKAFGEFQQSFDDATDAVFGIAGPMSATEAKMAGLGKAAEAAGKGADSMREAFDKLVSPLLDVQEAESAFREAIDGITESMKENGKSLDLNTEKGRNNAESLRTGIQSTIDWGEAMLRSGESAEQTAAVMTLMRAQLVDQASAFFDTKEEAEAYIDSLGLTPDNITTLVQTPGLLEASAAILAYDFDIDGIPDDKDTSFSANNLDVVKQRLSEYGVDLTNVPDEVLTAFLQENWERVHGQVGELATQMTELDGAVATPEVSLPNAPATEEQILALQTGVSGLDTQTATPDVTLEGAAQATTDAETVGSTVEGLNSKQGLPTVAIVGNAIVMIQLALIADQIDKLAKKDAKPNVSIPTFGLVIAQTVLMQQYLDKLGNTKTDPKVTLPTFPTVVAQILVMSALMQQLNSTSAAPRVSLPSYGTVVAQLVAISVLLGAVSNINASPSIRLDGGSQVINQLNEIGRLLNSLNGRVATTTVRNVTQNITQNVGGGMAGALINGPTTMNVGEMGYREALVPLDLPLSRIDPSVRGFAEMIRGAGGGGAASIGRQVNVYNTIEVTSNAADPQAVAAQVMNRAAALAN